MKIELNDAAIAKLFDEVGEKISAQDKAFRATHTGRPFDEIEPAVRAAFPGLNLTDESVHDYARAVSAGEPFRWVIGEPEASDD